MKKYLILKINGYLISLNSDNRVEEKNISFLDFDVKEGDIIYLSEEAAKEKILTIGKMDSKYGRQIFEENDKDLVILVRDNIKYYLKRIYG